ncbi:MAG: hypothetical protein KatS3mg105_2198 [Gemmatales bacterium]|nr:MAG: hypothetical protein KatS3mg105_2198 [Gemmatales bacterium]
MIERCLLCALLAIGLSVPSLPAETKLPEKYIVYFGTYTGGKSKGIYRYYLDTKTGKLTYIGVTEGIANPSFLAIHPNKKYLYAVTEVSNFQGKKSGAIAAFRIDPKDGGLTMLNHALSGGSGPCHLVVDRLGKTVLAANYGSGSVCAIPIAGDGKLKEAASVIQHKGSSVDPRRQKGPHAHSINVDANNRFAVAADLGLDKLLIYRLDADKSTLTPNDPAFAEVPPGSGPRHFAFHPSHKFAYVINEMKMTITAFAYDPEKGALKSLQTISTLPAGEKPQKGFSTAEVQVHPSGKFLYGSNRGHDTIAIFAIDQQKGTLRLVGHESTRGKTPRNFGIDPSGNFLLAANQSTDNVAVFRIDPKTGKLKLVGQPIEVPRPVCVKFLAVSKD